MFKLVKVLKISIVVLFCVNSTGVFAQDLFEPILRFGTNACDDAATKKDFVINIRYTNFFPTDNEFKIELSDVNGVFPTDRSLATYVREGITNQNENPTLNFDNSFRLPDGVFGTNYRVRVEATNPADTFSPPSPVFSAYDLIGTSTTLPLVESEGIICGDGSFTIEIANATGKNAIFEWFEFGATAPFTTTTEPRLTVTEPGRYQAKIDYGSCGERETVIAAISGLSNAEGQIQGASTIEICADDTHTFTANTNSTSTYNYQWFKDGSPVGPNSSTFTTANVGQFGRYSLETSSKSGSCTVSSNPVILQQQTGASFTLINEGDSNPILMPCESIELKVAGFPASATFQWFKDGVELRNRDLSSINVIESGDYIVRVTEPGSTGSCDVVVDSEPFMVRDLEAFVNIQIRYEDTAYEDCIASSAALVVVGFELRDTDGNIKSATDAQLNPIPPQTDLVSYQWFKEGVEILGETNNNLSIASFEENGIYELEVRSCSPAFTVRDKSNSLPVKLIISDPIVTSVPNTNSLCAGSTITYTINTLIPSFTYEWFKDGSTTPFAVNQQQINITEVGEYTLRFSDASCEKTLPPISVVLFDESVVQVTPSETVVLDTTGTATITASGAEAYMWYLGEDTMGTLLSTTASLDVNSIGFYTLAATVGSCEVIKTIEVVEQDNQIIVPNIVTPNGDGINDTWQISNRYAFQPNVTIIVYNASGKEILNVTDYTNDWPSNSLGNQSIFYYKIIRDEVLIKAGTISILD